MGGVSIGGVVTNAIYNGINRFHGEVGNHSFNNLLPGSTIAMGTALIGGSIIASISRSGEDDRNDRYHANYNQRMHTTEEQPHTQREM